MKRFSSYVTKKRLWYAAAAVALVLVLWFIFGRGGNNTTETLVLSQQQFLEQVALSGKVIPAKDVDLGFSQGGRIARVYVSVGQNVGQGALLAEVENADARAGVQQQQAVLEQQQAKLDSLKAGSRPEDVAASQAALDKAKQDLANYYLTISDVSLSAYTSADDATRTQLNGFFSNPETANPQLNFQSSNSQSVTNANSARVAATDALSYWQAQMSVPATSNTQLETQLATDLSYLSTIRALLTAVSQALDGASSISAATIASYRASVSAAQSEVNASIKSLNTVSQNIASQKLTVSQAQAQLDLKRAGSSSQDIAAQQAMVSQAQASVLNAQAQLQKTLITAPFSGTVTKVDAKVGLTAGANSPQISLESSGTFQIETYVPEVSIASIQVGDTSDVTLDAYGAGTKFSAAVISIDPAETVRDGISTYRVLLQFSEADPRIRSGMTASLSVVTNSIENALVIPQGAIFQKDGKMYVQIRRNSKVEDVEVTVGARSIGNTQILSGLSVGDEVVLTPDTTR